MTRLAFAAPALAVACALASAAFAAPAADARTEAAKTAIWAKEKAIYAARAHGDMGFYVANSSPAYMAWPPTLAAPEKLDDAAANANITMKGGSHEKIESIFKGFTLDGDTALIYYDNHRTMRGDGAPVDETFSNIHVWVKRKGDWRLLGNLSRPTLPPTK